jgi:chlorophyllase
MGGSADCGEILAHLASHGYVVVAPQIYEADWRAAVGFVSPKEEAQNLAHFMRWARSELFALLGCQVDVQRVGLIGYSRGGATVVRVVQDQGTRVDAVALLAPAEVLLPTWLTRSVVARPMSKGPPALVIGTALGAKKIPGVNVASEPEGQNHERFFEVLPGPTWHVTALDYGHTDVIGDAGSLGTRLCRETSRMLGLGHAGGGHDLRRLCGGLLASFFAATLKGQPEQRRYLEDPALMPVRTLAQSKPGRV